MKHEKVGNILDVSHGIIVQQVNAQGVMNSGVAKAIRERYPVVFEDYQKFVDDGWKAVDDGRHLLGTTIWSTINTGLLICSAVTQQFYGRAKKRYTSYDAMDVAFAKVATMARVHDLPIHYPHIGAGLGGGDWTIISAIIEAHWGKIEHTHWTLPPPNYEQPSHPGSQHIGPIYDSDDLQ